MEKYVLIDGNSLLNRAFYAMSSFATKDGLPTNGIFGFIRLLFKVIEDERPPYLTVAFDVHAPTFRHKAYPAYKATRKPMPEELVRQVPVLKDLLKTMKIHTVELAGYEADDLIGTLSHAFPGTEVLIYTGDRDAYQLVDEHVSVCFTKRGVSVTDRITLSNFFEKTGLKRPAQIVDEKALMGDSSDNIPGVKNVGQIKALELLGRYGDLDNVYRNVEETAPSVRNTLVRNRDVAYLSYDLATIDRNVPLDVSLEDCRLRFPLPAAAKAAFAALEFRSLLELPYFEPESDVPVAVECPDFSLVLSRVASAGRFSFHVEDPVIHVGVSGEEYLFPVKKNLLGEGYFPQEISPFLQALFSGKATACVLDVKALAHRMDEFGVRVSCPAEDVSLMFYLSDSNRRASNAKGFAQDYGLPETHYAVAIGKAYEEATQKLAGTVEEKLYRELELPLADVLLDMERTGVRVNEEKFRDFSDKYGAELDALSEQIYELAGVDSFNLNSPFQLPEILFDKLGYDTMGAKRNLRGGFSTSAEVLERLAEKYEIARLILRYREVQKLQSTYIDGIRPLVSGGLVHTTYNQTMTTTGRLSSANPNLQNIPVRTDEGRELRKLFVARKGNILVDADYSQIELRLLAHFSGSRLLRDAYNEGKDIHAATASQIFGVRQSEVTPLMRRRAKVVNFGIIYGMSPFGLSKDLNCSNQEAQEIIDKYFEKYPDVKAYMDENVRFARENGYVNTILGRKRYIPELRSSNYMQRHFGERAAMNMPLQGSSADIIKIAMLGVFRRLNEEKLQTKLVLQVHDELVLDAPLAEREAAEKILKEEMEGAVSLSVPLTVELNAGESWYDAK